MGIFGNRQQHPYASVLSAFGDQGQEPPLEPGQISREDWERSLGGDKDPTMNIRDIGDHLGTKGGFFGKGGAGDGILGWARDILAYGPTAPIARMQRDQNERRYQDQQAEDQERIGLARRAQDRADNKIDWVGQGDDLIGFDGMGNMVDRMAGQPSKTAALQNYEAMMKLPENQREAFRSMLGGYGYTPGGIAAQGQIANSRAQATAANRAPPRGGGSGGGGVTPTSRANAIAQAEAAISRGADRNAVYGRLAKMGIK